MDFMVKKIAARSINDIYNITNMSLIFNEKRGFCTELRERDSGSGRIMV